MSVQEFEVYGQKYRITKLNAFQQFHVTRRLYAVSSGFGTGLDYLMKNGGAERMKKEGLNFLGVIEPVVAAIGRMSNEDSEYVINTCLGAVFRSQSGGAWVPVMPVPGQLQFEDIQLPAMLALTWRVLQENLAGFFLDLLSALRPMMPEGGQESNSSASETGKTG